MEKEPETINDLPVGYTIAKGLAWSEKGKPGYSERIDGAEIINIGNGKKCARIDKGKTGIFKDLSGETRIMNIKMRET